ncbi:hypothetical protein BJ508DRAFT_331133 [Ascobolus immersus RN42]|uniref:Uncharacterized protein n=1 Tax=Ascobolus immersus RN42 TaxID=1160509 RepID=A0A3N4HTV2_ASCIM|nr:hypothetical protein BJ508DRAFT_331133 [Ascobolus immersus RN42]
MLPKPDINPRRPSPPTNKPEPFVLISPHPNNTRAPTAQTTPPAYLLLAYLLSLPNQHPLSTNNPTLITMEASPPPPTTPQPPSPPPQTLTTPQQSITLPPPTLPTSPTPFQITLTKTLYRLHPGFPTAPPSPTNRALTTFLHNTWYPSFATTIVRVIRFFDGTVLYLGFVGRTEAAWECHVFRAQLGELRKRIVEWGWRWDRGEGVRKGDRYWFRQRVVVVGRVGKVWVEVPKNEDEVFF